jgi:beta-lactam-binding protein with PASTA domain
MIDLRGSTPAEVNERLADYADETGLSFTWVFDQVVTTNPAQHGLVVGTTPSPGTPIGPGQEVVVRFGTAP